MTIFSVIVTIGKKITAYFKQSDDKNEADNNIRVIII